MEKFAYTGAMLPVAREITEKAMAEFLFEHTKLDDDDSAQLAEQLVILVASYLAPHLVVQVIE